MTAFPDQPSCRTPKASATAGRFTEAMVGSAAKSQPQSLNVFGMLAAGFLPCRLFPGSGAWSSVLALYADLPFMYLFELAADDLCGPVTSLRATSAVATGN